MQVSGSKSGVNEQEGVRGGELVNQGVLLCRPLSFLLCTWKHMTIFAFVIIGLIVIASFLSQAMDFEGREKLAKDGYYEES